MDPEVSAEPTGTAEISKNALKKQQKAEEAAKKKAEKDAEKALKAANEPQKSNAKIGGDDDDELDPTKYYENRLKVINQMQENGVTAFPHKFHASLRLSEFIKKFDLLEDGSHVDNELVSVTGRVLSKRGQGKLMFYDLHAEGMKIQIMSDLQRYEDGEDAFRDIHNLVKRGLIYINMITTYIYFRRYSYK